MPDDIRELRILFDLGGDLHKVCKLTFTKKDASLYLFPYAPSGQYYYGKRSVDGIEFEDKFPMQRILIRRRWQNSPSTNPGRFT
jgi:hypothetical protein